MTAGLIFALVCALLAIAYGVFQSGRILRLPDGNDRMREIAAAVRAATSSTGPVPEILRYFPAAWRL